MLGRLGRQWRIMCSDDCGDSGEECARTIRETVEKNVLGRLGRQWRRMCSDDWGDSGEECARTIGETVENNVI